MNVAVYAGTFDPITNGHMWMIEQGSKLFDQLIVAIGVNPNKKCMFDMVQRREMIYESTKNIENVSIDIFENKYLVHYATSIGADYILRGIRNPADYEYEKAMRFINDDIRISNINTIFLMPPKNIAEVSSSMVKGLIGPEGWETVIKQYIPEPVYKAILSRNTK